ncbi:hypothetical protein SSX86_006265 [Deinandra increscens subsp. villosa]|uniref:PGG domain-containing protein n=1 Tax=Deinandra increscens subsp. villosa TaxID=3103831 RepID=A0AAP0DFQ4_9ASTR
MPSSVLARDLDDERIIIEEREGELIEDHDDHQSFYKAIQNQEYDRVNSLLEDKKVKVTEKITTNGNTALHLVIGTTKMNYILKKILVEMTPEENIILDMKNLEGSTLLHVAAIVGNTEAAELLVEKNEYLLFTKDKEGHTPLARALLNMHTDTYKYLLSSTTNTDDIERATDLFQGTSGDDLLVNAISSKYYDLALLLSKPYKNIHSDAPLMAIAQNFPRKLSIWERNVYKCVGNPKQTFAKIYMVVMICIILFSVIYYFTYAAPRNRSAHRRMKPEALIFYLFALFVLYVIIICIVNILSSRAISRIYKPVMRAILRISKPVIRLLATIDFKFLKEGAKMNNDARDLLKAICDLIKRSTPSGSHRDYYNNPILEASRQNAYEVVVTIASYFPNAIWSANEDGHNIIQYAVINRSEKVYNLLYQMSEQKNIYRTIQDPLGNNLLHLAARLAPTNKLNPISGAALQIQSELKWFQEVKGFVCPPNIIKKNCFGETPHMVFTREHKELVIEGEKWMKATANSYTITAALITTIMFASAITVPGGNYQETINGRNNQEAGTPIFAKKTAFRIFAIADAVSLFTSVTSLLMNLSILTSRFSEKDFLLKLPTKLIVGLTTLFISTTAMLVAFGATLYLVFGDDNPRILGSIAALTCLPITSFVTLQYPLIRDQISSTYGRSIFGKKSDRPFY